MRNSQLDRSQVTKAHSRNISGIAKYQESRFTDSTLIHASKKVAQFREYELKDWGILNIKFKILDYKSLDMGNWRVNRGHSLDIFNDYVTAGCVKSDLLAISTNYYDWKSLIGSILFVKWQKGQAFLYLWGEWRRSIIVTTLYFF